MPASYGIQRGLLNLPNSVVTQLITDTINAPDLLKDSFINLRVESDDDEEEEYTRDEDGIDFSRNTFDIIIVDKEE